MTVGDDERGKSEGDWIEKDENRFQGERCHKVGHKTAISGNY